MFLERVFGPETDAAALAAGGAHGQYGWADAPLEWVVTVDGERLRVVVSQTETGFAKTYVFAASGLEAVEFTWRPPDADDRWFATEVSHQGPLALHGDPEAETWSYPIETVAKSERGLERTLQGTATVLRWPARLGAARIQVGAAG